MYDKCAGFCERPNVATSVITAGDCWAPNFLVRDIGQNQKEALMLDFQLARCCSLICDLSFLIYSCTQKSFRDQYYDDALKVYYSELSSAIKSLGSDPEKIYPWNLFLKEVKCHFVLKIFNKRHYNWYQLQVKDYFVFGLTFSLESIPFCLLDPSESFDLDAIVKGDEAVNIADVWTVSNIKTSSGRRRLADAIVHAVENGYLWCKFIYDANFKKFLKIII